jgi:murein DD-endopeptidase MepM/ murein hydrolase activator NlpD
MVDDSSLPLLAAAVNSDPNPLKGERGFAVSDGSALLATAGPDGVITDTNVGTPGGDITTYTVKEGDSISSIAKQFGVSSNTILWANDLTSKSVVKPGSSLVILPITGIEHTVQKGETVASIAKKYSGDVNDILSYNGLAGDQDLKAGDKIIIPDGEPATPTPSKSSSKSPSVKSGAKKFLNLPSVGGFSNPLPAGTCTQGIHDNNGVDIGAHAGTPIYAAAAGSVIVALGNNGWNGGFGNYVVINHPNGTQTLYAHMIQVATAVGASVDQGQLIGYVGSTGKSTGNHLHFEVHKARNPFCSNL